MATYGYSLSSGVAPVAGHLVTVTGTTNANGTLNVVNGTISVPAGVAQGTFTINLGLPDAVTAVGAGSGNYGRNHLRVRSRVLLRWGR